MKYIWNFLWRSPIFFLVNSAEYLSTWKNIHFALEFLHKIHQAFNWFCWLVQATDAAGEVGSHLSEEAWNQPPTIQKNPEKNAEIYGCFQKWWYPKSSILIGVFHHKPSILGYHYFWKHPYAVDRWLVCSTIADCGDVWGEGSKTRSSNA